MPSKRAQSEVNAILVLTKQEWELVRNDKILTPAMKKRFDAALATEERCNVVLTSKQIETLLDAIMHKLDHDPSNVNEKMWLVIFDKAHYLLEGDAVEGESFGGSASPIMSGALTLDDILNSLPSDVKNEFAPEVKRNPPKTLEEFQDFMHRLGNRINQIPDPEMSNLTPEQVHKLIYADWNAPDSPIRFNRNIPLEKLRQAEFLISAREFLTMLVEQDGFTKTTQSGYLTRRFVSDALDRFTFLEGKKEKLLKYSKIINETDVFDIHIVRIVLEFAGLIRKQKGAFRITRKGRELLGDHNAGELYTLLFITMFRKFNLEYLDRYSENAHLQHSAAFMLYCLMTNATKWTDLVALTKRITLPKVQEMAFSPTGHDQLSGQVEIRFLRPLSRFGLVECRIDKEDRINRQYSYRISPLFKRFIDFHL